MQLESINVGAMETIRHNDKSMMTGICKYPVDGAVLVDPSGIPGDAIHDKEHHGGPDQAIYAYSADDYDWWEQRNGRKFGPGLFGENLTIRGMPPDMNVGDRLLIGDVVLEATAPRVPCSTFATRMQDSSFGLQFRQAERPGVYFRVLNGGTLSAGDTVSFVPDESARVSILELFHFNYALQHSIDDMQRYLDAPVAERFREKIEIKLAAARP